MTTTIDYKVEVIIDTEERWILQVWENNKSCKEATRYLLKWSPWQPAKIPALEVTNSEQYQPSPSCCSLWMSLEAQGGWALLWVKWHSCNILWFSLFNGTFCPNRFCNLAASHMQSSSVQSKSSHRILTQRLAKYQTNFQVLSINVLLKCQAQIDWHFKSKAVVAKHKWQGNVLNYGC